MSKSMYGSIDFSKLLEEAKKGNKAFKRAENGKIYLDIKLWINDEPDTYNNNASLQSNPKKENADHRFYFGNLKYSEVKPIVQEDIPAEDDLPY
jgi:hypothetical protein